MQMYVCVCMCVCAFQNDIHHKVPRVVGQALHKRTIIIVVTLLPCIFNSFSDILSSGRSHSAGLSHLVIMTIRPPLCMEETKQKPSMSR